MVKAVNLDNEIKDALPKASTTPNVSIINPEDKVEFNIDFSEDSNASKLATISEKAMGGTELMKYGLHERLPKELLEKFQIIPTRVRDIDPDRIPILWVHDLAHDPEVKHLKDVSAEDLKFARLIFVSYWQLQQFRLS